MHFFLVALLTLFPLLAQAQANGFEDGYYILAGSPVVRHPGQLHWVMYPAPKLLVKGERQAKELELGPNQLHAFSVSQQQYLAVEAFDLGRTHVSASFARQLDSGQVVLLLHLRPRSARNVDALFLVRRTSATTWLPLDFHSGAFWQQALPFLATRPDLVKLVEEKRVSSHDFPALVHAVNTGQPYSQAR